MRLPIWIALPAMLAALLIYLVGWILYGAAWLMVRGVERAALALSSR